jgi:hypothetical protein
MEGKRGPAKGDRVLFFQSFNTPGNEVAPGSDEIRKDLQNRGLVSFHGHSDPSASSLKSFLGEMMFIPPPETGGGDGEKLKIK